MSDFTAVVAGVVSGFVYRLRWDHVARTTYLEMTTIDKTGHIDDQGWAPIPSTPESEDVLRSIENLRKSVGVMSGSWVE